MKVNTKSIVMSLALVLIGNQARSEHETAATELRVLNQQSGRQNRLADGHIDATSRTLTTILPQINFEPYYGPQRDVDDAIPNGATAINEVTMATLSILRSERVKSLDAKDSQSPSLKAIDDVVAKIDGAIDPNWKHLPVSSNVMPPAGTPNASAGMSPDAISDPQIRKQYMDLINANRNNNLKNGQQRTLRAAKAEIIKALSTLVMQAPERGWSQATVAGRFCKDEESIKLLAKELRD